MREDNVTKLNPKVSEFAYTHIGRECRLWCDERYLYEEWSQGPLNGKNSFLLHRLSPSIVDESITDHESIKNIRKVWLLFLSAIVIFFSDFQSQIPLLVPALVIYGVFLVVRNIRKAWPRHWINVYDEYNFKQVGIVIPEDESSSRKEEREKFVSELIEGIENAKKKEFYGGE
jgi:hypothetical protein